MIALPAAMIRLLRPMERVFRESTWEYCDYKHKLAVLANLCLQFQEVLCPVFLPREQSFPTREHLRGVHI